MKDDGCQGSEYYHGFENIGGVAITCAIRVLCETKFACLFVFWMVQEFRSESCLDIRTKECHLTISHHLLEPLKFCATASLVRYRGVLLRIQ